MTPQAILIQHVRGTLGRNHESASNRKVSRLLAGKFSPASVAAIRNGGDVKVSNLCAAAKALGLEVVIRDATTKTTI